MARLLPESELLEIYRQTIRPLYGYVSRRVGGDRPLAEDLVQDTWTRGLRAWPARGTPDDPLRWLITVAHNVLVSHYRRVQPDLVDPAALDLVHAAARSADSPDAAATIGWGLARLKQADAEILEAFYFDGSPRQAAASRLATQRDIGTATALQLAEGQLKLKEADVQLQRLRYELLSVQKQIADRRRK